jgi:hypothetical protein
MGRFQFKQRSLMPQIYLIAGLAWAVSVAAAGWYGMELGDDRCIARAAKAQAVEDRAVAAAAMAAKTCAMLTAATLLTGCATSIQPSPAMPLILANCPPLQPLADDTFGATTLKLIEVATQYQKCRAAALR